MALSRRIITALGISTLFFFGAGCAGTEGADEEGEATGEAEQASTSGCTLASFGAVCFYIVGTGLNVQGMEVVRDKLDPSFICQYKASVTAYYPDGHYKKWWSPYHQGCTPLRAYMTFDWPQIPRSYPNGTKVCGSFFENNERQGTACEKIHS